MLRLLSHSTSYFSANYVNYVARSMSLCIIAVASVVNNLKIYNIAALLLAAIYFDAIREYCFNRRLQEHLLASCVKQMEAKYPEIEVIITPFVIFREKSHNKIKQINN